jgi:hypothetical protein
MNMPDGQTISPRNPSEQAEHASDDKTTRKRRNPRGVMERSSTCLFPLHVASNDDPTARAATAAV